jgi:hypothetical protein
VKLKKQKAEAACHHLLAQWIAGAYFLYGKAWCKSLKPETDI